MGHRDARPLSEKALSAMHDAAIEEIRQGHERWGLPTLLAIHTGMRRRLVVHFTDEWITTEDGEKVIQTPKEIECNIKEDGCKECHSVSTGGPDGVLTPKTGQGEQRTIPLFESWYDRHLNEQRETELPRWLNHWFETHDAGWGYRASNFGFVVKRVGERRYETIKEHHQGEKEMWMSGEKEILLDLMPHDFRATFATQCIKNGVEDSTLQDWAGWETIEMVNHYRGFVGDPDGTERGKYEDGRADENEEGANSDVDMAEVVNVYSSITEGKQINPTEYDEAVLEAAYEMVQAS